MLKIKRSWNLCIPTLVRLASVTVAGAVIQAIGRPEFEDGLRTGVQLVLRSGLQSVCTHLWSKMAGPMGLA